MKKISDLNDLIKIHTVDTRSIQYLIENPTEIAALIKNDFRLAISFFDYFNKNPQMVNDIVTSARTRNSKNYVFHYTFMTEIINIATLMTTTSLLDNPVISANVPYQQSQWPLIDLADDLIYDYEGLFGNYKHTYRYRYSESIYIQTKETITNQNRATVAYDPSDTSRIRIARSDCQTRKYVKQNLPLMIIKFLEKLNPDNTLDYEFTSKFFQYNTPIQNLIALRYFSVITALLKCVTPEVASQLLLAETINLRKVLHEILFYCHSDQSAVATVKQAIDCMRALKNKNQHAFEVFIDTPKGFDLLQELKIINVSLAKECYNIHPEFMKSRFTASGEGLETAISLVGGSSLMTPSYNSTANPAAPAASAATSDAWRQCRLM